MRKIFALMVAVAAMALLAERAGAAESWGLPEEQQVRFEGKVVDLLCELSGDCPESCGSGERQLGLLTDEGKLVLPIKNVVIFAGTTAELIDFCDQRVLADGLFTTNRGYTVFALQFVKPLPDGDWRRANRFQPKWAEANGVAADSKQAQQWYLHDPRVKAVIGAEGKLGLGLEADKKYQESQQ